MKKFLTLVSALSISFSLFSGATLAKEYPEKPVVMNVAYSPGGGNDTVARLMAKHIEKYLGEKLVVENVPGAGGQVGFTRLANSKKDGYTVGLLSVPSIILIEQLRKNVRFKLEDFQTIAAIQSDPILLAVNSNSKLNTFEDFKNLINSSKVNVGGDGPQSNVQLQAAVLSEALGKKINFVSYSGSGPTATGLLSNEIDAALLTASSSAQFIQSGKIRVLAVFSEEKHPLVPEVKTASELLGKEIPSVGTAIRGVAAPKGIDNEKVKHLESAFKKLTEDEDFKAAASKMGIVIKFKGSEEFGRELLELRKESSKYINLVK